MTNFRNVWFCIPSLGSEFHKKMASPTKDSFRNTMFGDLHKRTLSVASCWTSFFNEIETVHTCKVKYLLTMVLVCV